MSTPPVYTLELRAADQRKRLHSSVTELRARVQEKLDFKKTVRQHVPAISGVAAIFSFVLGYGLAGIFTRH